MSLCVCVWLLDVKEAFPSTFCSVLLFYEIMKKCYIPSIKSRQKRDITFCFCFFVCVCVGMCVDVIGSSLIHYVLFVTVFVCFIH